MLHNHKWDLHVHKHTLTDKFQIQFKVCLQFVMFVKHMYAAPGAHGIFNNVVVELCSSHCKYEILKLIVFPRSSKAPVIKFTGDISVSSLPLFSPPHSGSLGATVEPPP